MARSDSRAGVSRLVALVVAAFGAAAGSSSALGEIEAEHPSELVRVLETEAPELWDEAVTGLLGDGDELNRYAVRSVVRRLPDLAPEIRVRVARALRAHGHALPALWELAHEDPEESVREAAMESLLKLRAPGAMDAYQVLIESESPYRMEALDALVGLYQHWLEHLDDGPMLVAVDPVFAPENTTPADVFDRRYLHATSLLLRADEPELRAAALRETAALDTPGLRDEWLDLASDPEPSIRWEARWTLARKGDPRPCAALIDELTEEDDVKRAGRVCAPSHYVGYFRSYEGGSDRPRQRLLIEGATARRLLEYPGIMEAMEAYADHPDDFLRSSARRVLDWQRDAEGEARASAIEQGIRPAILALCAFVSFVLGALLFVWASRLFVLATRVRHRPVAKIATMPLGPVALEGKVQLASGPLRHPLTDEPCVYYAGADVDHPDARFYLADDSGRVLVDPRRAVLFSDDGVLVAGERVHLVGHAEREFGKLVVGKDRSSPPLYRRIGHWVLGALFGLGRKTSVTKMLFTDPSRCFWIWDDLERRPMGEASDVLWLGAGVLLAGAWVVVFAVSVMGIIDQEMSAALERALQALVS